jgi:hypothetical protein
VRIDEAHPVSEEGGGDEDLDAADALAVVRIPVLAHVVREARGIDRHPVVCSQPNSRAWLFAVTEDRHHRRDGNYPGRQDLLTDKSVDEGRLAPLELAHADDVEAAVPQPLGQRERVLGDADRAQTPRDVREVAKARRQRLVPS